jgi:hypothetical protein
MPSISKKNKKKITQLKSRKSQYFVKRRKQNMIKQSKSVVRRRDYAKEKITKKDRAYENMMKIANQIKKNENLRKERNKNKKQKMIQEAKEKRRRKKEKKREYNLPISVGKSLKFKNSEKEKRTFIKGNGSGKIKYLERGKLKYYLRKGNNYPLMSKLIEKRQWWESIGELNQSKFN